jgi:pyrimidine-nucleoside phosphorylase
MNTYDIIAAKRDGKELTAAEIGAFVRGVTDGSIPDYQASAWLMAVYLRGMSAAETLALTLAMRDSGARIDLSDLPNGPALDKHSTGGVGDKTTLVVVPILAALGVPMLKMSGRGLGFSGGTVDKLESIPGFRTGLTIAEAKAQTARIGAALIAQSAELAPADKILYALRDVTATVESIPLIAASIMSKKLAAGAGRILLDVKVGRGAFMKTRAQAEALARTLVALGADAGVPTSAVLTAMEEPLGADVGNALEVAEAIVALRPNGAEALAPATVRFRRLCVELAAHGLLAVGKAAHPSDAIMQVERCLTAGAAGVKFAEIVAAQGGPATLPGTESTRLGGRSKQRPYADRPRGRKSQDQSPPSPVLGGGDGGGGLSGQIITRALSVLAVALPKAPHTFGVRAEKEGVVTALDAEAIGRLAMAMGAGRATKSAEIDPAVGIVLRCKISDPVTPETEIAVLHLRAADVGKAEAFAADLRAAYSIGTGPASADAPLILASLDAESQ